MRDYTQHIVVARKFCKKVTKKIFANEINGISMLLLEK